MCHTYYLSGSCVAASTVCRCFCRFYCRLLLLAVATAANWKFRRRSEGYRLDAYQWDRFDFFEDELGLRLEKRYTSPYIG